MADNFFPILGHPLRTGEGSGHYPGLVSESLHAPAVPPEAQARQRRLLEQMHFMTSRGPSREPACLQELRKQVEAGIEGDVEAQCGAIQAANLVEEAVELLRGLQRHPQASLSAGPLLRRLMPFAAAAQARRSAHWQLDSRRARIRFHYAKGDTALAFDEGDLQVLFLQALRLEGFAPALDLGKRPRPWLAAGLPLPAGVASADETMDAVMNREPLESPEEIIHRMNLRLPEGLRLRQWRTIPGYAAPVADLALSFQWHWDIPGAMAGEVDHALAAFLSSPECPWARGGSILDLRKLLRDISRERGGLRFTTPAGPQLALNPLKVLGAALGLEPARITGLSRTGVNQKSDTRLSQGQRFEPKLRNMYEDAVLLGSGSNITLVEEDDDEPLRLG